MGAKIKLYTYNLLETGTTTVTGTADTGYPEERLHDRSIGFYWVDTVTEAKIFHVDQGATTILDVDALIIGGHNFDGEDMTIEHSANDADWTAVDVEAIATTTVEAMGTGAGPVEFATVAGLSASGALTIDAEDVTYSSITDNSPYINARGQNGTDNVAHTSGATVIYYGSPWTQDGSSQIVKTIPAELNKRYWRVTLSSMTDPRCAEMWITYGYEFGVQYRPSPLMRDSSNVIWSRTVGGSERSTKFGEVRRIRQYGLYLDATDLALWDAAIDYLDGYSKPFYLTDHEGDTMLGRFDGQPAKDFGNQDYTTINFTFLEIL